MTTSAKFASIADRPVTPQRLDSAKFKDYDVFASRLHFAAANKKIWWEEFECIGHVKAFNSAHAVDVAKEQFPGFAERIGIISSLHPLSPTMLANTDNLKGALATSIALNRMIDSSVGKSATKVKPKESYA